MRCATVLWIFSGFLPVQAANPPNAVFWSAKQMKEAEKKAEGKLNPATHVGSEQLLDSATLLYRVGASEAEIHEKRADLIIVREGEGSMVVGGRLVDAKPTTPGEIRGKSIEGGETHSMAAGDTIWVPANTPHQFLVQPGKHFIAVIVKIEQN